MQKQYDWDMDPSNAELREIAYLLAIHNLEVRVHHIPGVNNTILDLLSHWDLEDSAKRQFRDLNCTQKLTKTFIKDEWFEFSHNW